MAGCVVPTGPLKTYHRPVIGLRRPLVNLSPHRCPLAAKSADSPATLLARMRVGSQTLVCRLSATGSLLRDCRYRQPRELLDTDREPTSHPLGEGCQHSEAFLYRLIVLTAETIVPPPMHPLRLLRKDIKNAKLAAQLFSNFLPFKDQALSGSRLPRRIRQLVAMPTAPGVARGTIERADPPSAVAQKISPLAAEMPG
jgi:hypothetical protein